MFKEVIKSKIQNLVVTDIIDNDEDIIIIDQDIMDKADIMDGEKVTIFNISNGYKLDMLAAKSIRHSTIVCIGTNSESNTFVNIGNNLTLLTYKYIENKLIEHHKMISIDVFGKNKIIDYGK